MLRTTLVVMVGAVAGNVLGQGGLPDVNIYPGYGATALSAQIQAQANYMVGAGAAAMYGAEARRINALASQEEARTWKTWVNTYFELRDTNDAWRRKRDPDYRAMQKIRQDRMKESIRDYYQDVTKGADLSVELNWLLNELAGMVIAQDLSAGGNSDANSNLGAMKLSPEAIQHIRFTDGARSHGKLLTFRADQEKMLQTRWPRAFRTDEFVSVCGYFDSVRDEAVGNMAQNGKLDLVTERKLTEAVDRLSTTFNEVYTPARRTQNSETFVTYANGRRYLQELVAGVYRFLETDNSQLLAGRLKFEGDTVLALLRHMYQSGLEFAPADKGDEGTYKYLFQSMQGMYLHLTSGQQ